MVTKLIANERFLSAKEAPETSNKQNFLKDLFQKRIKQYLCIRLK